MIITEATTSLPPHGEAHENNDENDAMLIQRILQQNDMRAFQTLYRRHAPVLLRRLHRLTGDPQSAEEGLQQVFLEAYRSLSNYRGDGPFGGWLQRITERVALRLFQQQWRSQSLLERWGWSQPVLFPSSHAEQETRLLQHEVQEWMQTLLQRLPPGQRWVVLLCDLEGKTTEEAAESLGIPRGTVSSRLYHARKKVRTMIEHELRRQGLTVGDLFHGSK